MGQRLIAGIAADPELQLAAAIEAPNHPRLGVDAGEMCGLGKLHVPLAAELTGHLDGLIDFSVPAASLRIAKTCVERTIPLVVCTTGFTKEQRDELVECHHDTPLMITPNASLVVAVLSKLLKDAARLLKNRDFDVEIIERHHRFKTDAPSGTALRFAEIIESEMGLSRRVYGREGVTGERPRHELGIHAVRTGDNVGEHTVIFSTIGETLELVHRSHSRDSYVNGALVAVKFLAGKHPGLYTIADALGI
jgi:4-hydroxy-tetrahydrodipicolinate reductase